MEAPSSHAAGPDLPAQPESPVQPPDQCSRKPGRFLYLALLVLVLIAPFLSILAAPNGRVLGNPQCDNPQGYYYINHFAGQCWRQGIIPLWNPYIMLGIPFLGDGEASVFHPLSSLFAFLQTGIAINWLIGLSIVLTGLFCYGYFRALGLRRPASWCGAVTFCFSSVLISRVYAGHLNILLTLISMPLILMLWERYRAGGGVRCLAGIAFAYGLMILAFYPLVLYIFSLFFLLYVLIPSLSAMREKGGLAREGKAIGALGVSILAGVGVGAIQLFPSLEFVGRSFREQSSIEFCGMFSFPPENLVTALVPHFFGSKLDPTSPARYWGRCFFWEMWLYAGILPLAMAAVGAWAAPRRRTLPLVICGILFLLIGLGKNTPLFPLLYAYVPFFDAFRGSSKYLLIPLFCLIALSAYGFQSVFEETDEARRRRMCQIGLGSCIVLLVLLGGLSLFVWGADQPGSRWERSLQWLQAQGKTERYFPIEINAATVRNTSAGAARGLVRAGGFLLLAAAFVLAIRQSRWRRNLFPAAAILILADLSGAYFPMLRTYDESITRMPEELDQKLEEFPHAYPPHILYLSSRWPNRAMYHEYSSVFGYTGNTLRRYNDFLNRIQGLSMKNSLATQMVRNHTKHFRMLAIDACIMDKKDLPEGIPLVGDFGDKALVPYDHFPRAFLAEGPRYFAEKQAAFDYVLSEASDVLRFPAVERTDLDIAPQPLQENESARIISYSPNRVEIETTSNAPRILVLCGMYSRHWKATVNGDERRVVPANYVFRAVRVDPGDSTVVLEYRPTPFYQGAAVTGGSVLLLLGILGIGFRRGTGQSSNCQSEAPAADTEPAVNSESDVSSELISVVPPR